MLVTKLVILGLDWLASEPNILAMPPPPPKQNVNLFSVYKLKHRKRTGAFAYIPSCHVSALLFLPEEAGCKSSGHTCSLCVLHSAYVNVLGYKRTLIVKRLNFDLCTGCVVGFISAPQARLGLLLEPGHAEDLLSAAVLGIRSSWPHRDVHSTVVLAATDWYH